MDWQVGDPVYVDISSLGYAQNLIVASRTETGPLAVLALCGAFELSPHDGWGVRLEGEPFAEFEVEGISAEDAKAVRDFVSPGDAW